MTNETKKRAMPRFDYTAHDIVERSVKALEGTAADIQALGRKSTEQAFLVGALLEKASELVEARTYGKWVQHRCDITPKTARNYRSVARNLAEYRERAIELGVIPTVLFHLASAPAEKIEAAFAFAEENDGIRVSEVKALLSDGVEATTSQRTSEELADVGGLAGLRAMIELKTKAGTAAFLETTSVLRAALVDVLTSKPDGKRLQKTALIPVLEPLARAAKRSLGNVLLLDAPGDIDVRKIDQRDLAAGSRWFTVLETLDHLGNRERWPGSREVEPWLTQKVMPLLDWAVTRTKQPEWPLVATPTPDSLMPSGLEVMGGVVRIAASSIDPIDVSDTAMDDFEPPAFLARKRSVAETDHPNVVPLNTAATRSGLRKPNWMKSTTMQPSAE
ncbi:hypothetical protein LJR255_000735 [Pararhizobium sp. LjRoot255]|uniref:hypothetical protein n=1 Tax=Pararhizobium sp. LjRoot255 TaxID=3342298 RepID=UPI003ECE417B